MATELHIYDGAVYREATEVHIYDGATYRDCSEVHIYDGTAWRLAFQKLSLLWTATAGSAESSAIGAPPNNAILTLATNGDTTVTDTPANIEDPWCTLGTGNGASLECFWTQTAISGTGAGWSSTPTQSTWLALSTQRQWVALGGQTSIGTRTITIDLTIRFIGDAGSAVTKSIDFITERA